MGVYTHRHDSVQHGADSPRWAAADERLAAMCPALVEFLTECRTEDGVPRITSTVGVSCEDGYWKVCLTDRAQQGGKVDYKLWKSGNTLEEAFRLLDKDLQDGTAEWRKFPKWTPPKRG